jgi:hypothetical protein
MYFESDDNIHGDSEKLFFNDNLPLYKYKVIGRNNAYNGERKLIRVGGCTKFSDLEEVEGVYISGSGTSSLNRELFPDFKTPGTFNVATNLVPYLRRNGNYIKRNQVRMGYQLAKCTMNGKQAFVFRSNSINTPNFLELISDQKLSQGIVPGNKVKIGFV